MHEKQTTDPTVVYVGLTDETAIDGFKTAIAREPELSAISEKELQGRLLKQMSVFLQALQALIVILAIGAVFACANTMHSAFLARLRELATLRAIGFTPGRIVGLLLQEALIIAGVSGAMGLAVSMAINGRTFAYTELGIVYTATVTPMILATGAAVALVIGVLGAIASVIQAVRLDVLDALRTA
jgi:putative ABC transport system permease protein